MAKQKQKTKTPEESLREALVPADQAPYEIPANWCWVYWGKCGRFIAGNGFKKEYQGHTEYSIPFYKVGSLKYSNSNGYLYDRENTVNEEIVSKLKATIIPVDSIIFAKIGEAIRLNRRSLNSVPCCIDNNLMAFVPDLCSFKYAYYWSKGQDFYKETNATTVPAIRKSDLEIILFPLPPLVEQQRIVERIESLFAKLDEAKEKAEAALQSFELRRAAILHKAFTGVLTAKWREEHGVGIENWREYRFDEVACIKSNLTDPSLFPDFPHIAPDNIEKKTGRLLRYRTVREDKVTSGKHHFYSGQILYSKIRPYLSKVVIIDFEGLCSADMYPIEAYGDAKCLWYYMLSEDFLRQTFDSGSRTVLPKINQKELNGLKVHLTSVAEEQKEIVRLLDDFFTKEQQAKALAESVLKTVDTMKQSILARAFRGELGTGDSGDETARDMLVRMYEEKVRS